MKVKGTKYDYIRSFITENNLFTLPTRTLSKMILHANPKLFGEYNEKNIDKIRSYAREIRDSKGRKGVNEKNRLFAEKFHGFLEPDLNDYSPFTIPESVKSLAILNDIHIPFHNKTNLDAAIEYLKKREIDGILLNGDILDCYKASRFLRDPRKRDMEMEFDALREFIDSLNYIFKCPIFYKLGNHEERIENAVLRSVPELVGFLTFESCLAKNGSFDFKEYNLQIIKDKRIVQFTKYLSILHGHEYRIGIWNPVGVARWLFMKARTNAVCGHAHRKDSFSTRTLQQQTIETHSIGCLCDMNPEYRPLNDWQSGFAYVKRLDNGHYKFTNILIENGEIL